MPILVYNHEQRLMKVPSELVNSNNFFISCSVYTNIMNKTLHTSLANKYYSNNINIKKELIPPNSPKPQI